MTALPPDSGLYGHLWSTPELRALFDDAGRTQGWLDVLAALAALAALHAYSIERAEELPHGHEIAQNLIGHGGTTFLHGRTQHSVESLRYDTACGRGSQWTLPWRSIALT